MKSVLNSISLLLPGISWLLMGLLLLASLSAGAKTILVTNTNDDGPGSLRDAVRQAVNGDEVELDASLAGKTIILTEPIRITGSSSMAASVHDGNTLAPMARGYSIRLWWPYYPRGASQNLTDVAHLPRLSSIDIQGSAIISGGNKTHLFEIGPGTAVTIEGLTLVDGYNSNDGGAIENSGLLTLKACWMKGHVAEGNGGAVSNQSGGTLTLDHSTLSANKAAVNGGALANAGLATLKVSTLFGNQAGAGGGLYTLGDLKAYHVTVSQNHAGDYGGGLVVTGSAGLLTLGNSLVVGNTSTHVESQEMYQGISGRYFGTGSNIVGQRGIASVYPASLTGYAVNMLSRDQTLNPLALTPQDPVPMCTLPRGSFAIDIGDADVAAIAGITDRLPDVGAAQYAAYHLLAVTTVGSGTVTSIPALINCGTGCLANFTDGSLVTLQATPNAGATFTGWSPSPCAASFTMPANNLTCTATFNGDSATIKAAVGVFRAGTWFLDANANGTWEGCQQDDGLDLCLFGAFGMTGDRPVAGHWDGGAKSSIGVLRSATGEWFIDRNGNHQWDGCGVDGCYVGFGTAGDLPVAGDWNGTGFAKIGVFHNGQWYLDANGNGVWDGCGTELCLNFGQAGDQPVAGHWDGGIKAGVGVFRAGTWYLDYNGNGQWDGCEQDGGQDQCLYNSFGMTGDLPAAGDWNGDGKSKVGVFRAGTWYLDYNGNGAWDGCGVDRCYVGSFGIQGDLPVAGKW